MRVLDAGRRQAVDGLTFSPDGTGLAVGMRDRGAAVHDLAGSRPPVPLDGGSTLDPSHLIYAAGRVYAATDHGRVGFDSATGEPVSVGPSDPSVPGYCLGFAQTPTESRLVTTHGDVFQGTIVWLAGWVPGIAGWERAWLASQGPSSGVSFSAAGDRIAQIGCLTSARFDYYLLIRDAATGEIVTRGRYPYTMLARPRFRPDGRQVVATRGMVLVVWDTLMPGKPQRVQNDTRQEFTAAAYHPSGRYLFTTSNDATVTVWDTDSWVRVKRFDWDVGRLRAVAVSPDGLLAAAGSDRGRVVVWDVDL
jgi:WD40 repeat protein